MSRTPETLLQLLIGAGKLSGVPSPPEIVTVQRVVRAGGAGVPKSLDQRLKDNYEVRHLLRPNSIKSSRRQAIVHDCVVTCGGSFRHHPKHHERHKEGAVDHKFAKGDLH